MHRADPLLQHKELLAAGKYLYRIRHLESWWCRIGLILFDPSIPLPLITLITLMAACCCTSHFQVTYFVKLRCYHAPLQFDSRPDGSPDFRRGAQRSDSSWAAERGIVVSGSQPESAKREANQSQKPYPIYCTKRYPLGMFWAYRCIRHNTQKGMNKEFVVRIATWRGATPNRKSYCTAHSVKVAGCRLCWWPSIKTRRGSK